VLIAEIVLSHNEGGKWKKISILATNTQDEFLILSDAEQYVNKMVRKLYSR
jgi:hypothetical protein